MGKHFKEKVNLSQRRHFFKFSAYRMLILPTPILLCRDCAPGGTRELEGKWGEWLKEFNTKRKGAMKRRGGNVNARYRVEEVRLVMVVHSWSTILTLQRQNYEDTNTNQEPLGLTRREAWTVQTVTLLVV